MPRHPPSPTLFPYTTLFRSKARLEHPDDVVGRQPGGGDHRVDLLAGRRDERQAVAPAGLDEFGVHPVPAGQEVDRKSTRLNSSHTVISYAVFCLKKKKKQTK